jgi:hypothetical protein
VAQSARPRGWTVWRNGRYSLALTISAAFGVLLGARGER